jgi:hypothetical protein
MRSLLKSGFFWRFAGGFALGAIGLFAMQPAQAVHQKADTVHATR